MINIASYDLVDDFDSRKPYIDKSNHKLYLNDIYNFKYYTWLKRFNKELSKYDYYLLLTNTKQADIKLKQCNYTNSKQIRVLVDNDVFNDLSANKPNVFNLSVVKVEEQDDCIIYNIDD